MQMNGTAVQLRRVPRIFPQKEKTGLFAGGNLWYTVG